MDQEEKWLLEEKFNGKKTEEFFADLELLKTGTPLGYLIGHIPFLDCVIYLDSKPLIPRSETEFWVEKAITQIKKQTNTTSKLRVLDLCAGSGCIGIAVAKAIPCISVKFSEIDLDHISTIQKNILNNKIDPTSSTYAGDLFENIPETSKYSFILTNPPYIDPTIDRVEESVKIHEPHTALYGGDKGMEVIQKIITEAPNYLNHRGELWVEHEPEQSEPIAILAESNNFSCTTHKDQYGVERYSILVLQ